jgi:ankyrin repeat protein
MIEIDKENSKMAATLRKAGCIDLFPGHLCERYPRAMARLDKEWGSGLFEGALMDMILCDGQRAGFDDKAAAELMALSCNWESAARKEKERSAIDLSPIDGFRFDIDGAMKAIDENNARVLFLMAQRGFDFNQTDGRGWTPLTRAVYLDQAGCSLVIAADGMADPNMADSHGMTPLLWACQRSRESSFLVLMDSRADVRIRAFGGQTPAHLALGKLSVRAIRMLAEAGDDFNARDKNGRSPMHIGAAKGLREECEIMVAAGARCSGIDAQGRSPADLARAEGFMDLAARLAKRMDDESEEMEKAGFL